jgi:peptide methionine sulfoxide reductase MsrB
VEDAKRKLTTIQFYDSNTGHLLFEAPNGRSHDEFLIESQRHGWPSFRDAEVNWEEVRCLRGGETVSLAGTHLGHNLPDKKGNRYCINLVSCAGNPIEEEDAVPKEDDVVKEEFQERSLVQEEVPVVKASITQTTLPPSE